MLVSKDFCVPRPEFAKELWSATRKPSSLTKLVAYKMDKRHHHQLEPQNAGFLPIVSVCCTRAAVDAGKTSGIHDRLLGVGLLDF